MKKYLLIIALCFGTDFSSRLWAAETNAVTDTSLSSGPSDGPLLPVSPTGAESDNTKVNSRDRDDEALTPLDQSNRKIDVLTTQKIRKSLMSDKTISMNGKNVKIITTPDGTVTLRGPVNSVSERETIYLKAVEVAGKAKVHNLLELKAQN